ncbi:MAG TPA: IPT/TIG domain-containing protein, partial [Polyangiaceae bacterium]|nr:IPT/TIG domain-containing protein [Polyangiaceae bacterium]
MNFTRCLGLAHALWLAACFSEGPAVSARRASAGDGGTNIKTGKEAPLIDATLELATDPHALIGVEPSRGSFRGRQTRMVRGNGFATGLRVWFGATEIPSDDILPVDPNRAQIVVPPGEPGRVDVRAQIGNDASTARVLQGGYLYETFYADPRSGPTSGGTVIHLLGKGTAWSADTTVTVDDRACEPVVLVSPSELTCTVPPNTAGAKSVSVTEAGETATVRDGYTYADSDNGFKGGLSGPRLAGHLKVLVYDDYSGVAVPGAFVLAGDDVSTGLVKKTASSGVVVFDDPALGPTRSVTVAAKCHDPITFVDVPVDTLTVFLTPVLSPACKPQGDPPAVGGRGVAASTVRGEIVWPPDGEFKATGWSNVPKPVREGERLVAYVFELSGDPRAAFALPDPTDGIRPSDMGTVGFP